MVFSLRYGGTKGKKISFIYAPDLVAIRLNKPASFQRVMRSANSPPSVSMLQEVCRFEDVAVSVLRVPTSSAVQATRDQARTVLKASPAVRFAGRVLSDRKSGRPVLYTENYFVKFHSHASKAACLGLLDRFNLTVKQEYKYAPNTYFVASKEGTGAAKVFNLSEQLLQHKLTKLCHPELIRERGEKSAYRQQWHLKIAEINGKTIRAHSHVEQAWALSRGASTTICIIDDGVDVDHQDFAKLRKVVHGRDVTQRSNNPRPKQSAMPDAERTGDAHGTACAGVACASGEYKASGVAPDARLLPIRYASGLGSIAEHDAFVWAADHNADVISCSWGPPDGAWYDPEDPFHKQVTPLPDSTRTAMEYAVTKGREGKGCVITWAAGNGNESVDNDGYASSEWVIAVAACSDRSTRSVYSDFGNALWCAFPSNNFDVPGQRNPLTPGIWTTDRSDGPDEGYNPWFSDGDKQGKYTDSFGGTSSACPGVAGVVALMLAVNPELDWITVCNIIADTCDQIDKRNADYDADTGHSQIYGFGRINAKKAVEMAQAYVEYE